jgi:hypothetical protein
VRVVAKRIAQMKRRLAGAVGVILQSERRAEQGHDPVASELVHGAFEAVHAVGKDLEEGVENVVPLLGVELFGERHRALHVGKEHRHVLALALERRFRCKDLLDEVSRRVRVWVPAARASRQSRSARGRERLAAAAAEASLGAVVRCAVGTGELEGRAAGVAESRRPEVLGLARGAVQGSARSRASRTRRSRAVSAGEYTVGPTGAGPVLRSIVPPRMVRPW